jgi:hypothetical protein
LREEFVVNLVSEGNLDKMNIYAIGFPPQFSEFSEAGLKPAPSDTYFVQSNEKPGGIGEPGTVIVQPAILNAIHAATGVQLTRMPVNAKLLRKQRTA